MVDAQHQSQIDIFFADMCKHLTHSDVDSLVTQFHVPAVFVNEGDKVICANRGEILTHLNSIITTEPFSSAVRFEYGLAQTIKLSATLFFVQVRWQWFDQDDTKLLTRVTSYTMQENASGHFDIVVSVTDEDITN